MRRFLSTVCLFTVSVASQGQQTIENIPIPAGWEVAKVENASPNALRVQSHPDVVHSPDAHAGGDFAAQMAKLSGQGFGGGAVTAFYPPLGHEVPRQLTVVADSSHKLVSGGHARFGWRAPHQSQEDAMGVSPRKPSSRGLRGAVEQEAVRKQQDPEIVQAVVVASPDGWMPRSMLHSESDASQAAEGPGASVVDATVEATVVDKLPSPAVMAEKEKDRVDKAKAEVEAGEVLAPEPADLPACDPSKCAIDKKVKKEAAGNATKNATANHTAEPDGPANYTYNITNQHDSYLNPAGGVLVAPSTESTPEAEATPLLPSSVLDTVRDVGCLEKLQKDPTADCEPHHFVGGPAYPVDKKDDDESDDDDEEKADEAPKASKKENATVKADEKEEGVDDDSEEKAEETAESAEKEAARLKKEAAEAEEKAKKAEERAKKLKGKKKEGSEPSSAGAWLDPFSLKAQGARAVNLTTTGETALEGPDPGLHPSLQAHSEIGEIYHTKKKRHGHKLSALRERAGGAPKRVWPLLPRYPA